MEIKPSEDLNVIDNNKKNKNILKEIACDYCANTSIHGLRYLGEKHSTIIERIWWLIIFTISVICCLFLIMQTWTKWKENPLIVSFAQEQIQVWDVPFPAVTVCPLNKVNKSYYNYTEMYNNRENLSGERLKKFWDISLICNLGYMYPHNANSTTDENAIEYIKEVSPNIGMKTGYCKFQEELFPNENLFFEQLTSEGICYTFNSLGQNDMYTDQIKENVTFINHNINNTGWTIENGFIDESSSTYPKRTSDAGISNGLSIMFYESSKYRSYTCGEPIVGFKIMVHNPAESPHISQEYILASTSKQITIAVTPDIILTSKGLQNVPISIRNCYSTEKEKKLRFFKIYTQNNCKVECLSNVTKVGCGCVPFYSPRDNVTEICGYGKNSCVGRITRVMVAYENMIKKEKIDEKTSKLEEFKTYQKCKCLPACTYLHYKIQTSQTDFYYEEWLKTHGSSFDKEATKVQVFFKESQFLALYRSEFYGQIDFLAYIGGLMGLFMGFSVLSFMEIIYFITLRLWRTLNENKT